MPRSDAVGAPRLQVPLAPMTTLQVGGAAQWFVSARTADEVAAAYSWAAHRGVPVFVLGGGSNVVVADGGVPGLVLHASLPGVHVHERGDEADLVAAAGESWDGIVARAVGAGYAGLEALSGIPGLVGGTPIQNVGAYGQEVSDTIHRVVAFDTGIANVVELSAAECGFAYRQSRFKKADAGRFVICGVSFRLRRGAPTVTYPDVVTWVEEQRLANPTVADIRRGVIAIRRRKGMVLDPADPDTRSVGSFFMNPVVPAAQAPPGAPAFPLPGGSVKVPAAWLIERAGIARSLSVGGAAISSKHPLAIVNRGGASSGDVLDLAARVKRGVLDFFGIALRPEPVFAGFGGDERVAFLQRDSP